MYMYICTHAITCMYVYLFICTYAYTCLLAKPGAQGNSQGALADTGETCRLTGCKHFGNAAARLPSKPAH